MSMATARADVVFPDAAVLTNEEGVTCESSDHPGVAASAGPPTLTRYTAPAPPAPPGAPTNATSPNARVAVPSHRRRRRMWRSERVSNCPSTRLCRAGYCYDGCDQHEHAP